jgi:hypothetical protein
LIKFCTENELQKFSRLDLFLNCFSSVALSLFSKPTIQNNKKHHTTPIMTKTMSSATTSHAMPVKAKIGKWVVKNKILHIEEEPPVTALKQSSLASVSTGTTVSLILLNQESSPASVLTALTVTTASWILSSQSTQLLVQSNPTCPISRALLTLVIYRSTPRENHTSLTFAILLMSRANALSTYLMQVISLLVKKANGPSFLTTSRLKIFKWLSLI